MQLLRADIEKQTVDVIRDITDDPYLIFEDECPSVTSDFVWSEDECQPDYILNHKGEELIELHSWDFDPAETVYYNCDTGEIER